ncbi:NINE protein [Haliscomenobacter sp.]|uniref:NINE protein n=1 Tax=Haliscomenobacter sp. TaxID=2717303 RepID=UPI003364F394
MKNKIVAAFLALFVGIFGVHRFYLQRWWQGVLQMCLFFVGLGMTIASDGNAPFVIAPAVLAFVDALLFFVMPQEDFDEKYNKNRLQDYQSQRYYEGDESEEDPSALMERQERSNRASQPNKPGKKENKKEDIFKRIGIEQFRSMNFEGAIESFMSALEDNLTSPSVHFNLACCYSMIENADKAFQSLEKAIESGFTDISKIHSHQALSFIRKQPEFEAFVANGYHVVKQLPVPQPNILDTTPLNLNESPIDVLDEVLHLGDLREKGLITEEEFVLQKKKLLG